MLAPGLSGRQRSSPPASLSPQHYSVRHYSVRHSSVRHSSVRPHSARPQSVRRPALQSARGKVYLAVLDGHAEGDFGTTALLELLHLVFDQVRELLKRHSFFTGFTPRLREAFVKLP